MLSSVHRRVLSATPQLLVSALRNRTAAITHSLARNIVPNKWSNSVPALDSAYTLGSRASFSSTSHTFDCVTTTSSVIEPHSRVSPDGTIQVQPPQVEDLSKVTLRLMRDRIQRTSHPPAKDYITLSFYQFRPIDQDDLLKIQYYFLTDLWAMDVVGRIYVSAEGINAQISCPKTRVQEFKDYYATHWPIFDKIRFNPAMSEGKAFKKLHVRIKGQLVADGIDNSTFDLYDEPTYLTPEEWHNELSSLTKPPILIDMRNHYESTIGHFENAIRPDVTTFRENVDAMLEICEGKEDQDIYMYCTGGIRCTRSGALLKSKGFKSVKMLQGGVTAYGRYVQEQREAAAATALTKDASSTTADASKVPSIYKGKNFTFDKRLGEPITDDVLAKCHICGSACDTYCNCANTACNLLMISCPSCLEKHEGTCGSGSCVDMVKLLNEKQKNIPKDHPGLVGMKARLGIKPFLEHRLRVRPLTVMEMRKNKLDSQL
ncbi:hypothetical protein BGZ51_002267 [Haplosporangium sp. Z 767]|nr:hypothetical protein BGZ51_002267 [Haplosporangium sp. Z 767]KAF9194756.1 hypothetical protein BGZ50_005796 [Haplosporangium sp. Z 11]